MRAVYSRRIWVFFLVALFLAVGRAQAADPFFQIRKIDGTWWLIDPDGHRFLSKGVTTVELRRIRSETRADRLMATRTKPSTARARRGVKLRQSG